ncbi:MAG TPA: ABC transporter permease, partial [Nitrolancea sp.]|nr:ABC transporter permease [Nitrolancea sp.]
MGFFHEVGEFFRDPNTRFAEQTVTYLKLCAVPILISIVTGVLLGVLVARRPIAAFIATNLSGLARAIPTIAFLAIVLPYLGIGFTPAVLALTALGIPPILLNTIAGLRGIDPMITEAARGTGMTAWQVLIRIQAPLALPVVAAGVRTSAVQIVATAPLAALIGAGGYGDFVLEGINLLETAPLVVGSVAIALLAMIAEFGLAAVERAVTSEGLRPPKTAPQATRPAA